MSVLSQKIIKDQQAVTREIAGEMIIVPIRSGIGDLDSIYTLNPVGTAVWQLINGQRTVAEIIAMINADFEVTPERAEADVLEFIASLQSEGLVRPLGEGEA